MKQKEPNNPNDIQDQIKDSEQSSPKEDSKNIEHEKSSQKHVLVASPMQGAMTLSPKLVKPKTTKPTKKKTIQAITTNVTRAIRSRGKLPKKPIVEFPKRKRAKKSIQSKGEEKVEQ